MTQTMHEQQGTAQQVAAVATDVAATTKQGVKATAGDAAEQAKSVAGEVKHQMTQLGRQTSEELRTQAESRSTQAAQGLRSVAGQIDALSSGRPQEAGQLLRYLGEGQTKLESLADRLEQRGPQGLVDDVTGFARRRPAMFMVGAIGAGFVVGRMIRASGGGQTNTGTAATYAPQQRSGWDAPSLSAPAMRTANPAVGADVPDRFGQVGTNPTSWKQ